MSVRHIAKILFLLILCNIAQPAIAIEPQSVGSLFILDPYGTVWAGASDIYIGQEKWSKKYEGTLQRFDTDIEHISYARTLFLCTIKKGIAYITGNSFWFPLQEKRKKKFVRNWRLPISDVSMFLRSGPANILLKNDGTVWTWTRGSGDIPMLGRPISAQEREEFERYIRGEGASDKEPELYKPAKIPSLHSICKIRISLRCALALQKDGTLWMWGNLRGAEGSLQEIPQKVLTNVRDMDMDGDFVLAVKNDDTLWVWGEGFYGIVGGRKFSGGSIREPMQVLDNVAAAFPTNHYQGTLVYRKDDTIWGWGDCTDCALPVSEGEDSELHFEGRTVYMGRLQQGLGLRPLSGKVYYKDSDGSFWVNVPYKLNRDGDPFCEFRKVLVKQGKGYAPVKNALRQPKVDPNARW